MSVPATSGARRNESYFHADESFSVGKVIGLWDTRPVKGIAPGASSAGFRREIVRLVGENSTWTPALLPVDNSRLDAIASGEAMAHAKGAA